MAKTGLANLIFLLVASVAVAGTREPSVPDDRHVEYGKGFECVAKLKSYRTSDKAEQHSSCVIISPKHVITAAHVVEGTDTWLVMYGQEEIPLGGVSIHEGFVHKGVGENDLAVGFLSRAIDLDYYPALYGDADEAGKVVSLAGYGTSGTFETGWANKSDGARRAGSNVIEATTSRGLLVCVAGGVPTTELEYCISPGDSGGGLFIGNKLAGIHSCVMSGIGPPKSVRGNESAHVRVSVHREWIEEQIKQNGRPAVREIADRGRDEGPTPETEAGGGR